MGLATVSKWVTVAHELSQSNPLSNQLTPWPSYIQQPKIDAQIATLEILRWNKKSKSFIFWHPRGNKSSIRFYLISSGVLDFHHCFLFSSDFRRVEPARKHRIISKEFQEKIYGFVKIWVPKTHCIVMIIMCFHLKCVFLAYTLFSDRWSMKWESRLSNHSQKSSHVQVVPQIPRVYLDPDKFLVSSMHSVFSSPQARGSPHWLMFVAQDLWISGLNRRSSRQKAPPHLGVG